MQFSEHTFPPMWKHACMISILKLGKDLALPSSYCSISLLDMICKLFENVLLTRILSEVSSAMGTNFAKEAQFF